uniref:Protein kinase domain-containing protein n=1 Tax=Panagrolaimus sp. PS1159 TaxID=55785 RepID=A0AC35GRY1_9BILA
CADHFGRYILIITVFGDHCEIHYRIGKYRGKKTGSTVYAIEGHRRSFRTIGILLKYYTNEAQYLPNKLRCGYSLIKPMDRLSFYYPSRMIKQVGIIGEGNFCQVQKVEQVGPENEERVAAMKACHVTNELKGTQAGRNACIEILHEARILAGFINYTYITMFYGICFDEPIPKLIMELCPYGSVESYITNKDVKITMAEKILIAHDIACGMQH